MYFLQIESKLWHKNLKRHSFWDEGSTLLHEPESNKPLLREYQTGSKHWMLESFPYFLQADHAILSAILHHHIHYYRYNARFVPTLTSFGILNLVLVVPSILDLI